MEIVMRYFLSLLLWPAALAAQGWIIPHPCETCIPRCRPDVACLPITPAIARASSAVHASLAGNVLQYDVDETYVNRGAGLGEADYYFPLPHGAAFQDLELSIDGKLVAGEVMDAAEARRVYENIVRIRRDPALVEWMGYGMLHARIFPIAPGERKRVEVHFQMVAEREGDALRVDYRGASQPGGNVSNDHEGEWSFSLTYPRSAGYGNPYSPTSTLDVHDTQGERTVDVRDAGHDVTVLLPVHQRHDAAITVLPYAAGGDDDFALITISPPDTRQQSMPRDVTFVVDVSGSMSGGKLDQARAAGKRLLETLGANDRFRIIDFSSDVRSFRDGFVTATREQVQAADRYLDALEANGSTNIEGALRSALGGADTLAETDSDAGVRRSTGRMGVVLFLTDGAPTVGERDPMALAALASRLRGARRVFTFGVGADVNASLIEQLALQGRGTASFVRPDENLERAVSIVAERLRDPVVADVRVRATGSVHLSDMLPAQPVDIFAGQDLVLLARYSGSGAARVDVEGLTNAGPITWSTTVNFPDRDRENAFVPRLWATQRIGWLSAEKRKAAADGGSTSEIDREIRELGERWGIPTEFSSYLVREPNVAMVPVGGRPVPQGVTRDAAGYAAAKPLMEVTRFERAKQATAQRASQSLAAADSASWGNNAPAATIRRAGTRVFVLRDSVWTDQRFHSGMRVIRVQSFGAGYFRVLELAPELRAAFAVGQRVLVAGRDVAIEVSPDGAAALTAADERAIHAEW